jgi:hypothetical protein
MYISDLSALLIGTDKELPNFSLGRHYVEFNLVNDGEQCLMMQRSVFQTTQFRWIPSAG